MLKKRVSIFLLPLLLCGCSILQVADSNSFKGQQLVPARDGEAIALVTGYISGFYFFSLPLFAGDPDNPGSLSWFTDYARTEEVTKMVAQQCKSLGADRISELQVFYTSDTQSSLPWVIPYLLYIKTASASAVAVKNPKQNPVLKAINKASSPTSPVTPLPMASPSTASKTPSTEAAK